MPKENLHICVRGDDFQTIHHTLGRIEGTQENIVARLDKINGSVAKNTNWRFYITGALAILSILIVPVIINYLTNLIK